ncbi:MAG: radical SAM protein [Gammaproteobacteria bacterium]|nr:radical SAM protein [Gammaproteobacteria bacterium]
MSTSLCNHCYNEIDATVSYEQDGVYLRKNCDIHGSQSIRIEEDIQFYQQSLVKGPHADYWYGLINTTALDVTRRCNVQCPHCYALPEDGAIDPTIEEIVDVARKIEKGNQIILMGAEPTMRTDLPELVSTLKTTFNKPVGIYTNAIRLASERYSKTVSDAIDYATVSLHMRDYLPNEKLFDKKLKGINNLFKNNVPIYHISFSLRTLDDLDEVFSHCKMFWNKVHHFRIRTPSDVGLCNDEPIYLSRLFKHFIKKAQQEQMKIRVLPSDNNPYHINVMLNNQVFRLIHFPSVKEVNMDYLQTPPYALFMPELGETNLVHQFIMQEQEKLASVEGNV